MYDWELQNYLNQKNNRLTAEEYLHICNTCPQLRHIKYEKTLRTGGGFKQCFNDVLGFRLKFDEYPKDFPPYFRVVDLRNGKQIDDGYRAIHLYYQRDSHSYPIEVQLWCGNDYLFNLWSHKYVYKYSAPENGKLLYELYTKGNMRTEEDFYNEYLKLEWGNNYGR